MLFSFILKNKNKIRKIIVWSILIFSTLFLLQYIENTKQQALHPYLNAEYDYKIVCLINKSVEEKLLSSVHNVNDVAFVLISDVELNNERVTAALLSDIKKANLTIYNPSILTSGDFKKNGAVISKKIANEFKLNIGDNITISTISKDYSKNLTISGIADSSISTYIADIIFEYPESFKEYFSSRLPLGAIYGEAYIKFNNKKEKRYVSKIIEITGCESVFSREDKIKELLNYYKAQTSSLTTFLLAFSGIIIFGLLFLKETMSNFIQNREMYRKLIKFSYFNNILMRYFVDNLLIILSSIILAVLCFITVSKLYSIKLYLHILLYIFVAITAIFGISFVIFYLLLMKLR